MNTNTATEYRNLPLAVLTESATNPRRIFEDAALKELAESIRSQGVLSPLLVRPLTDQSFEIVAGARRYRAAQMAEAPTVPVRIVNLTDAEALEAQLIENLQRRDVHPLEEAQGFKALLNLEDPKYSIEQIAAKVGQEPCILRGPSSLDGAFRASGRGVLCRGNRRRPRAFTGQIATRAAGTGTRQLLPRGVERSRSQGQTHPAPGSAPATVDRA
jgi:ParB/RepB/Spo0J family partition protein